MDLTPINTTETTAQETFIRKMPVSFRAYLLVTTSSIRFGAPTIWWCTRHNGKLYTEMRPAEYDFWLSVIRNGS